VHDSHGGTMQRPDAQLQPVGQFPSPVQGVQRPASQNGRLGIAAAHSAFDAQVAHASFRQMGVALAQWDAVVQTTQVPASLQCVVPPVQSALPPSTSGLQPRQTY
jgi:hypothetical protein